MKLSKLVLNASRLALLAGLSWTALHGQLYVNENFAGYTLGNIGDQNALGKGLTGQWKHIEVNQWAGLPLVVAEAPIFENSTKNLLLSGQGFVPGGGRTIVEMAAPVTSGEVWCSFIMGADNPAADPTTRGGFNTGSTQFWIAGGKGVQLDDYIDPLVGRQPADDEIKIRKNHVVAGFRLDAGVLEYYNVARGILEEKDPDLTKGEQGGMGEVYTPFSVTATPQAGTDPVVYDYVWSASGNRLLWVVKMDLTAKTVSYYVFDKGADIAAVANAKWKVENLALHDSRPLQVSGFAFAYTQGSTIGNIRLGKNFKEVTPLFNAIGATYQARVAPALTETGWIEKQPGLPVNKFWSDSGKNFAPTDAADYTGTAYATWSGNTLYVAVKVMDQEILNTGASKDTVEIYFDGDMSRGKYFGWPNGNYDHVDDYQFIFKLDGAAAEGATLEGQNTNGTTQANPNGYRGPKGGSIEGSVQNFEGVNFKVNTIAGGYVLVASFDATAVLKLTGLMAGQMVGFDVAVTDFDNGESVIEKTHNFWSDGQNYNWSATQNFGTLFVEPAIEPLAEDNFGAYPVGAVKKADLTSGTLGAAGDGWAGPWYLAWQPGWTAGWADDAIQIVDAPLAFAGDFFANGHKLAGNNSFARVARQLSAPIETGSHWVAFTMDPGPHCQVRLGWKGEENTADESKFNQDTGSVAGFTMSNNEIQYLDVRKKTTYVDPATGNETAEVYLPFDNNPYPNGPCLFVINTDVDAGMVNYYVFAPGDDPSDPANATWQRSLKSATDRLPKFDSFALFTVFSNVGISNLRIGDAYQQVVLPGTIDPVATSVAPMAPSEPIIDGLVDDIWAGAKAQMVTLAHGGKTITDQDLSGSWKAMWDDTALYLLVERIDNSLRRDAANKADEIEIFTDANYSRTPASGYPPKFDDNDIQWVFSMTDPVTGGLGDWSAANAHVTKPWPPAGSPIGTNVTKAITVTGTNVTFEVKIPWTSLGFAAAPAAGSKMGLDVQLNDRDDGDPVIEQKKAWADGANNAWQSTNVYGTVYLLPETYVHYKLTEPSVTMARAGGSADAEVTLNYQYGEWTPEVKDNVIWVTTPATPNVGDGTFTYTVQAYTGAYDRTAAIGVGDATLTIMQPGPVGNADSALVKGLYADIDNPNHFKGHWLGSMEVDHYPWVHTMSHGWVYVFDGGATDALWVYDLVTGWWWSSVAIEPFVYVASLGKAAYFWGNDGTYRYFYVYNSDGTGEWNYFEMSMLP